MINLALVAALALSRQDANPGQQKVKILGREVPVEFPTGGPFNASTPSISWKEWKLEVRPDGTIGRRFLVDGGWGDYKSLYAKSQLSQERRPYRIKVMVVQYTTIIETSQTGVVRQRRGSIDSDDMETIAKSLATFKGMIEAATAGALDVMIDADLDNDPVVQLESMGSDRPPASDKLIKLGSWPKAQVPFGPAYIAQDIAPQFNDEKFDTDDGVYHGPYDGVFVIHGGLAGCTTALVDQTPVTTLSYYEGDYPVKEELPIQLFEAWKGQLGLSAAGAKGSSFTDCRSGSRYPNVEGGPYFQALVGASFSRNKSTTPGPLDAKTASAGALARLAWADPDRAFGTAVHVQMADVVADRFSRDNVKVTAWRMTPNGPVLEFADVTEQEVSSALAVSDAQKWTAESPKPGTAVGEYECTVSASANGGQTLDIKQKGTICRGYVIAYSGRGVDLKPEVTNLNLDAKLSSDENVALGLYSGTTKVGTVLLGGDVPGPKERPGESHLIDRSIPADDQWHKVSIPLREWFALLPLTEIRVEAPYKCRYERLTRGPASIGISDISFGPALAEAGSPAPRSTTLDELLKIGPDPTEEQKALILATLKSPSATPKLTALSLLKKVKLPEAVPLLSEISQSASIPYALLSIEALGFQDTSESWAQIRQTVEHGTFDHNRRFAAVEITKKPDPAMAAALNFMATRSKHARLEAVRALGRLKTTSAAVFMATIMNLEPEPSIRLEIAMSADPNVGPLAKRLLYSAVNDPSQWVRMACYASLIDASDKSIQDEALLGVRAETVGVRMYLLEVMKSRAKDAYRPALRIAVTDPVPAVRAAALNAFATQTGPVDPNEVKNVFTDKDPGVQQALAHLASIKGFKVPSP